MFTASYVAADNGADSSCSCAFSLIYFFPRICHCTMEEGESGYEEEVSCSCAFSLIYFPLGYVIAQWRRERAATRKRLYLRRMRLHELRKRTSASLRDPIPH